MGHIHSDEDEKGMLLSFIIDLVNQGAMHYDDGTMSDGGLSTYAAAFELLFEYRCVLKVVDSPHASARRYRWKD
jgi:hypothetical protein